ncbi:hypothetical protein OVA11_04235 [Caulobacter sp. SL161]|uniref:hypothetical protein n=1 Tax=Caulobacter sp. SL161 TaxID=2995156 RepID=UPI002276CB0D|nr:hypothetical protein [Caulobacter sp. SL161]MCY1646304.1 hypothetical protein [Caulobacter sp. SL161]
MSDQTVSLIDRLANLSFRTKLFAVAVVYMFAMFGASEAGGGEAAIRFWFASALPLVWLATLALHWLSLRPRPPLGAAVRGLVEQARARPLIAAFYGVAAVAIEVFVVAEALGRPLFPAV